MLEQKRLVKEKKVKYAKTERDLLTKCGNHPNIVKLYYTFKDETYLCKNQTNFFFFFFFSKKVKREKKIINFILKRLCFRTL